MWERRGLDLLLAEFPGVAVDTVTTTEAWITIDLRGHNDAKVPYAIWRTTGCVYRVGADGAAEDDPWLIPDGSPYDDPR